ncbi:adrenocortical dysplasia protein homolog isoform X1 [Castor canadensis]|uniref:Adrenocortical dysplasia protein homolog isoform X1 n=1 Tax=Castor canadensis TaxID=51338 RepID=A0A8B7V5T3_CASCN|nr:adrenocortical dysplasia protein homolog isoform X2 [Castor canadensis]
MMAGSGSLVLRPWIRELILGSETLSSPRAGQLLKVLRDSETPGPSYAAEASDSGAMLLVSDGTYSVRCLVTREALDTTDWEEKEFGFHGTEGRLLLLQVCEVRIQIAEGGAPSEFYLQVDRFSLLPTEQPRVQVIGCNQDADVQKKLCDCLEDHLSESTSSNAGLTLSQLLDEVQEDQEHRGALVRLAESCLVLAGSCTATPLTHWAASHCKATEEAMYTVPSLLLHISENDQQILSSLSSSQRTQGTPALSSLVTLEESGASISLLSALPLAAPDLVQGGSSQPPPAICSAPEPLSPKSPDPNHTPNFPLLSCTPTLSPLSHAPKGHQANVTRAQKLKLEFRELGLLSKSGQPRTRAKGAQESCPVWDPPKRHRDGSAFQYVYEPPCTSLCAQVQAARLPPQLVAWALHFLMEPQPESELTQV